MPEFEKQFNYPVRNGPNHVVGETINPSEGKFICERRNAHIKTGGWPAFSYCPFCGTALSEW
jgi:hypothetical protein